MQTNENLALSYRFPTCMKSKFLSSAIDLKKKNLKGAISTIILRIFMGAPVPDAPMLPVPLHNYSITKPDMVIQCEYGLIGLTDDSS